jgi:hypothetical protein
VVASTAALVGYARLGHAAGIAAAILTLLVQSGIVLCFAAAWFG